MFRNNLVVSIRHMRRQPGFTLLNILGMALGLACSTLLINYLIGQASFDKFHSDSDRIYRINSDSKMGTTEEKYSNVPPRIAHDLVATMPEVEMGTVLYQPNDFSVRYGTTSFQEEDHYAADSMFLAVFDFQLLEGNPNTVLHEANRVLLTPALVKKYFGDRETSAVGETILLTEDRIPFTVEGIIAPAPANSQFQYTMLSSLESWEDPNYFMWSYVWANTVAYVKLREGADMASVNNKIPDMVQLHIGETIRRIWGTTYEEMVAQGARFQFFLQPLEDVYLRSGTLGNSIGPLGNIQFFRIFLVVALFVLLIACINFMNLSTAQSGQRAKGVGIRKTLGSRTSTLRSQFLYEALLHAIAALFIGLMLYEVLLIVLERWVQIKLIMGLTTFQRCTLTGGIAIAMALLSGWYPAYYLTRFRPMDTLKGTLASGKGAAHVRSALVVVQFTVSIGMIISTMVVYQQWQYARYTDVGFDREQVVVVENADYLGNSQAAFMDEIRQQPGVEAASWTTAIPGGSAFGDFWMVPGKEGNHFLATLQSDPDLNQTLGLRMKEGRFLEWGRTTDSTAIILNEAAVVAFGLQDPIGKQVAYTSPWPRMPEAYTIVGVVKDFHMQGFQSAVSPMGILLHGPNNFPFPADYIAVRYQPAHTADILATMEGFWKNQGQENPFQYRFLDESFGRLFASEQKMGKLFGAFSLLTILIACMGLFGLAAYTAERRTKEVGVRKVLGATEVQLLTLLNRHFTRLVVISFVLAAPLAGLAMQRWLDTFVYKTELSIWTFAAGGGIALLIAWGTVSYQSWRVTRLNPIESLRDE